MLLLGEPLNAYISTDRLPPVPVVLTLSLNPQGPPALGSSERSGDMTGR